MIINGKDVEVDFRNAQRIQTRVDNIPQMPENTKVEVSKNDLKDLSITGDDFASFNGFAMQNNTLLTGSKSKENRKDYYSTFQEMSECNFIQRGLQVIADDCSQRNEEGNIIKVYSDDDDTKEILEELFNERLNLNKELWSIIYETCKLGDNFYEIIPDSYKTPTMVARIRYLEPDRVNRIEKNGKLAFYTYTADDIDPEEAAFQINDKKEAQKVIYKLEPWQIIHFRITDKVFHPYGGSLLKSGVKTFKRLQLLEDGMVIYRLARVPERRVFKIDVGNLPTSEANRQVQRIKDNYRTTQILDDKGNINRTASALSLTQDIFVPVRDGTKGTEITSIGAGTALNNIDDIRYFRDQILWTMNIPPEYLGFTSDQAGASSGRGSLAMQDIKFSRFAQRIQYHIEEGLNKIAAIELFFKKKKKTDLSNFRIELTPPSNIKEIMDVEYMNQKMNLITSMIGTGLFPKKFILQYVMKMSKKEIDNLIFFKDLEIQQTNQGMDFGMGGIGGMPADSSQLMGQPIDNSMQQNEVPTSSVTTEENLDTEKLVKVFGKDILIEHKEDFAKLLDAMEEYNKSKEIKEDIEDNIEEDIKESDFVKLLSETMGNKSINSKNTTVESLLFENELSGLNFEKNEWCIFEEEKSTKTKKKVYKEKVFKY